MKCRRSSTNAEKNEIEEIARIQRLRKVEERRIMSGKLYEAGERSGKRAEASRRKVGTGRPIRYEFTVVHISVGSRNDW
jgi:hypothetical protein